MGSSGQGLIERGARAAGAVAGSGHGPGLVAAVDRRLVAAVVAADRRLSEEGGPVDSRTQATIAGRIDTGGGAPLDAVAAAILAGAVWFEEKSVVEPADGRSPLRDTERGRGRCQPHLTAL